MAGTGNEARMAVVLEARVDKLEQNLNKANRLVYGSARQMERDLKKANDNIANIASGGIKRHFDEVSKAALAGSGPLNSFAGGLNATTVAGGATLGVLALLAAGFKGAKDAMAFADEISDTADRIHVSTDALQLYRFALQQAGGEAKEADKAIESFSITLGNAQAGMPKAIKGFLQLGFTADQVKNFKDTDTALREVTKRIAEISSTSQRDAISERLGLGGLKQLIDKGLDGMDALLQKGRDIGIVMDATLLKRAADAQDEFETLSKIIDVQLKSALVDLAPVIIDLLKLFAQMASLVATIADKFRQIENRSSNALQDAADTARAQNTALLKRNGGRPLTGSMKTAFEHNLEVIQRSQAELDRRSAASKPAPISGGRTLVDLSGGKGGKGPKGTKNDPLHVEPVHPVEAVGFNERTMFDDVHDAAEAQRRREAAALDPVELPDVKPMDVDELWKNVADTAAKAEEEFFNSTKDGINEALHAVADGNAVDFLKRKLREALFDAASTALTNALMKAIASQAGNAVGSTLLKAGAALLGGFASGTDSVGQSGHYKVGEFGPEVVNLPKGAQVIPNDILRGLSKAPGRGGGGVTVVQPLYQNFRGAVVTEDLIRQSRAEAYAAARSSGVQAARFALDNTPARFVEYDRLGG